MAYLTVFNVIEIVLGRIFDFIEYYITTFLTIYDTLNR